MLAKYYARFSFICDIGNDLLIWHTLSISLTGLRRQRTFGGSWNLQQVFKGQMLFLSPIQRCQSTEGNSKPLPEKNHLLPHSFLTYQLTLEGSDTVLSGRLSVYSVYIVIVSLICDWFYILHVLLLWCLIIFGRPFVKRFALCYWTVVCLSCLFVTLAYCGQTVRWIKIPLGTEVSLGPGDIVLDGDPVPCSQRGTTLPNFRPMSVVAKWLDGLSCHLV